MDLKSIPKLTMLTFLAWKKVVTIALNAEGSWKIVEGRETQPGAIPPLTSTINRAMRKQREKEDDEFMIKLCSFTTRSRKAAWMILQMLGKELTSTSGTPIALPICRSYLGMPWTQGKTPFTNESLKNSIATLYMTEKGPLMNISIN